MNTTHHVEQILAATKDELLALTAVEMGLAANIQSDNQQLTVHLTAGFPVDTLTNNFSLSLQTAIQAATSTQVNVVFDSLIKPHRTQMPGKSLRGVKNVIAIASGKGGVGKSTVAVNLAAALARAGARVGLLDADIYGPSIPLMLGKHAPVQLKDDRYLPVQVHGLQAMSIGYLTDSSQALIWRGPMLAKSLLQMLDITLWDNLDYLFIDLPPGTGDIQLSLVQKIPLTGAIVVTTPQNVATLDAEKAITMFAKTGINVLGVVENMSMHICSKCGQQEALFGQGGGHKLSENFHTPLLGQLPLDSRIRQHCDTGIPIAYEESEAANIFIKTALTAAILLAKKPLNYADKMPPVIAE